MLYWSWSAPQMNPMRLLRRVQRLQAQVPQVRAQAQGALVAKQEMVDTMKKVVMKNADMLGKLKQQTGLQSATGCQPHQVRESFESALMEWDTQLGLKRGDLKVDFLSREDLNNQLFANA
mmetsp:Transcript_20930/g.28966  ORF Transcript_20930/g.28966 Transcript_20930/m.28966 type:complete len:120 (+) Transcript_20930:86-445(+)